ncbi:MAG: glycosyltransferase, partial [Chloroflexota bacterium]
MAPLVSVIIPTYNRAGYLPQSITSVLEQTYRNFELIIIDDGSTDNTEAIIQPFLVDKRVKYIFQSNQGRSAARNQGAALAEGQFLGFLDSDDQYLPTTLEQHLALFAENKSLGMSIGDYNYINETNELLGIHQPWLYSASLELADWLFNCYAIPSSVLIRKTWFDSTSGFDKECEIAEDWDLFLQLARLNCPMAWVRSSVCGYRQHPNNSVLGIDSHLADSLRVIQKIFENDNLTLEVMSLKNKAIAWVYIVFAKKYYRNRQLDQGRHALEQAITIDPFLAFQDKKVQVLEFLLTPTPMEDTYKATWISSLPLPTALQMKPRQLKQAQARVHMARFFKSNASGANKLAKKHLRAGLKLD